MAQERRQRGGKSQGDGRRDQDIFESVVEIKRCAAVVKGGRRFSFNAVVVVGDRKGSVGYGYGKAKEVPQAVDKAVKRGQKDMFKVKMKGTTIPHRVVGRFGAARIIMIPAAPGTGVIAGRGVRDVLVAAGVHDILTKSMGSTNPINAIRATLAGLKELRTKEEIEALRGVTL